MSHRAVQLAKILDQSSPDEIQESETLRNSFRSYFVRGNNNVLVHDLFRSWLQSQPLPAHEHPNSEPCNKSSDKDVALTGYFMDKRVHGKGNGRKRKRAGDVKRCVAAVGKLRSAEVLSPDMFEDFWFRNRKLAVDEVAGSRYHRLMAWHTASEESTVMSESARRLLLIYTHHEIDDLMPSADRRPTEHGMETRLAAAVREFAGLSGTGEDVVMHARLEARPYMELVRLFGLGIIFLAGTETRDLWRKSTNEELGWVKQYCDDHAKDIIATVQELQQSATEALLSGLKVYGANIEEFQSSTSLLSHCFKRDRGRDCDNSTNDAMNALATAAAIEAANAGIDTGCANLGWAEQAAFSADISTEPSNSVRAAEPAEGQSDAIAQLASSWFQGGLGSVGFAAGSSMGNEVIDTGRMWLGQPGDWNLEWGDLLQGFVPGFRQEMDSPSGAIGS